MTEEEAKTKWCPMVRFGDTGSVSNRRMNGGSGGAGEYSRCMASSCMMWVPERRNIDGTMTIVNGGYCGFSK